MLSAAMRSTKYFFLRAVGESLLNQFRNSLNANRSLDVETGQAPDAKDGYGEDYDDEFDEEDDYDDEAEDDLSDYNVSTITNRNGSRITISTSALEEQVRSNEVSLNPAHIILTHFHPCCRRPPSIPPSSSVSPSNTTCTPMWKKPPKVRMYEERNLKIASATQG